MANKRKDIKVKLSSKEMTLTYAFRTEYRLTESYCIGFAFKGKAFEISVKTKSNIQRNHGDLYVMTDNGWKQICNAEKMGYEDTGVDYGTDAEREAYAKEVIESFAKYVEAVYGNI